MEINALNKSINAGEIIHDYSKNMKRRIQVHRWQENSNTFFETQIAKNILKQTLSIKNFNFHKKI